MALLDSEHHTLAAADAGAAFAVVIVLLVAGVPLLAALGLAGVVLAQALLIGGPIIAIAIVRSRSANARRSTGAASLLGLSRPSAKALVAALLIGASFWYLSLWLLAPLAERALSASEREALSLVFAGDNPLVLKIVALAIAPAIFEELLLRGGVARSLRRVGFAPAIVISALLFGALHLSVARFVTTSVLGLVLGFAALSARSTLPAIVIHALNNSIALAIASAEGAAIVVVIESNPWLFRITAALMTGAGIALFWQCHRNQKAAP